MASAKTYTRGEWVTRAIELAEAAEMVAEYVTVRYDANGANGVDLYRTPSESHASQRHEVHHHIASGALRCDCLAHQHGLPCKHVGAVVLALAAWDADAAYWTEVAAHEGEQG